MTTVHIRRVPLERIKRAAVYVNRRRLPLSQIVAEEKPDLAITGVFYNSRWEPVCPLKAEGRVLYADPMYTYWALAWDEGRDMASELVDPGGASAKANYAANCILATGGEAHPRLYYGPDVGGVRGRAAVGLTTDGELLLFASADGSKSAMTPEALRDYLVGTQGCQFAIMLDGGGKVNCYDREAGVLMEGRASSQNLLLIWLEEDEKKEGDTMPTAINAYSKAKDGERALSNNFKVREFACQDGSDPVFIAPRLVDILQAIRNHFGQPVTINSGYRTPTHNAKVGGAAQSQHLYGTAADIVVAGVSPAQVASYAEALLPNTGGIGRYVGFTHIDVRETKSRWVG